ncbi:Putative heterokaryon incompatibility [Septoria linicola]|uniref:Heterokaryon incompatibility n=1 Tax=Septoria linicola TaxID=215465 RepID=A0A9Q9EML3_9PEZI|nr:putative heterokaryon incompatibility [Septoria linicola]USW55652.1 Putative heterokaryon incompatibility [Septoria linicola]
MAFEYQPLDASKGEIRLLTILRKQPSSEQPHCRLKTVSVDESPPPEFYSVSYCWGDPEPRSEITVDGQAIVVPHQTEQTLCHISECVGAVPVWIDAVCINQASLQERQEQIPLMKKIYSNAREGLVFLGPQDDALQATVQHLFHMQEQMDKDVTPIGVVAEADSALAKGGCVELDTNPTMFHHITSASPQFWPQSISCGFDDGLVQAFYSKAWFSRVWVVQEAILAPKSRCIYGACEIDLDMVLMLAAWICILHRHALLEGCSIKSTHILRGAANMWYMRAFMTHEGSMDCILPLGSCRDLQASDIRDKVFGQLAILCPTSELPPALTPDYVRPAREVFRDVMRYAMLESKHGIGVLCYTVNREGVKTMSDGFPSWVARFDKPQVWSEQWGSFNFPYERLLDATQLQLVRDSRDPDTLRLQGSMVSHVMLLGREFSKAQAVGTMREWFAMLDELLPQLTNVLRDRLVRLACADHLRNITPTSRDDRKPLRTPTGAVPDDSETAVNKRFEWWEQVGNACQGRQLAITEHGDMALVPKTTEPGDCVVRFTDCNSMFVLRPDGDASRFVGECYVDGAHVWQTEYVDTQVRIADAELQIFDIQ